MRTNEEILAFSRTVSGYYDLDELTNLLRLTRSLDQDSTIVEIGVEYGRSASIFLQCPENWCRLYLIDSRTHNAEEGEKSTLDLMLTFVNPLGTAAAIKDTSANVAREWADYGNRSIDLLHIDGDHGPGIWEDCVDWLPKLKIGGIMVAHDYRRLGADPTTGSVFPEVDEAIDYFTKDFNHLGNVNTQAIRRRVA